MSDDFIEATEFIHALHIWHRKRLPRNYKNAAIVSIHK